MMSSRTVDAVALRWSYIFVGACSLAVLTNGPSVELLRHSDSALSWESWPFSLPFGAVALAGAALIARVPKATLCRVRVPIVLIGLYLAWALISVLWSVVPDVTALRGVTAVGVGCFAIWLGAQLSSQELTASIWLACSALGVLSIIAHLSRGNPGGGGVHGLFANSNSLGPVAALGALSGAALAWMTTDRRLRVVAIASLATNIWMLVASQSETAVLAALLALLVTVIAGLIVRIRRVNGWAISGAAAACGVLVWYVIFDRMDSIAPRLGKSSLLSSRRVIWVDVRRAIAARPWRGYGFFAFWDDPVSTDSTYRNLGRAYGSAHDAFLEVVLGLGIVGAILFGGLLLWVVTVTVRRLRFTHSPTALAAVALLSFILFEFATESFVLWHSYLLAILMALSVRAMPFKNSLNVGGEDPPRPRAD